MTGDGCFEAYKPGHDKKFKNCWHTVPAAELRKYDHACMTSFKTHLLEEDGV
jgi:hypothetical protein